MPWSYKAKKKYITFRRESPLIRQEECENLVLNKFAEEGIKYGELTQHLVEVCVINIDWLLKDGKNFLHFSCLLNESNNKRIFQTDFLQQLVQEFWYQHFDKILHRIFLPWILYMICALYF